VGLLVGDVVLPVASVLGALLSLVGTVGAALAGVWIGRRGERLLGGRRRGARRRVLSVVSTRRGGGRGSIGSVMGDTRLEPVATGLDFPTSVALDDEGRVYVAEWELAFGGVAPGGRVWRIGTDGDREVLLEGLRPPVNGVAAHGGVPYLRGRSPAAHQPTGHKQLLSHGPLGAWCLSRA
jgi:hypothetical protein